MSRIWNASLILLAAGWLTWGGPSGPVRAEEPARSHPPRRVVPPVPKGPVSSEKDQSFFADPVKGDDEHPGTEDRPWRTLGHAIGLLKPGQTLYLRRGVYHENARVAVAGKEGSPITIRSYPGEQAVLDGGIAEFASQPAQMWEPCPDGVPGEYRSRRAYPNLRDVMGWFGDSMIGLHTYHHRKDLQATSELIDWENWDDTSGTDLKPLWCGPGLWYDRSTGRIHARLAHTDLPILGKENYRGETDPRKLPLVIAPFRSVPLSVDGAEHVRIADLVIRGGGYDAVVLQQTSDIVLSNVTVWAGSYGLRAMGARKLRVERSGFYGSVPPWCFRGDTGLRSYPGRPHRDITRFGTHALLVPEAGREFSVFAFPQNDDWEIAHCAFHDAHDGVYLGGLNVRFHHNLISDLQDDGIYISPMYLRYNFNGDAKVHIHQNLIRGVLTPLAFGGPELVNRDDVHIYRNVVDLRHPVWTGRPSTRNPRGGISHGKVMGDHGSPPWSRMRIYHNTFIMRDRWRDADMGTLNGLHADRPRHLFNNLFLHLGGLSSLRVPDVEVGQSDGNLYWQPDLEPARAAMFFKKYRASPNFTKSKEKYPDGFTHRSLVADPQLGNVGTGVDTPPNYQPKPGSPAIDAGAPLPEDWVDPVRQGDKGQPDIGAIPAGVDPWKAGR